MGRPRKTEEKSDIEILSRRRKSAFDVENLGIPKDPGKEYRFCDPRKVDEHKHSNGFSFTKKEGVESGPGVSTSDGHVRVKGLVLMDRSKDLAIQSRKEKDAYNRAREKGVRAQMEERVERLSSKYGVNLHKYVTREDGDN